MAKKTLDPGLRRDDAQKQDVTLPIGRHPGGSRDRAPVEVTAKPGQMLGMPPEQFLRDYWQKRPLLIRNAFPNFESPVTPDDLAGLACEELAPSRIVIHDPPSDTWSVEHGPFEEKRFRKLPKTPWTLLVQDCDKLIADVDDVLAKFDFVPSWRLDDVMISYAVDGGSVGPHLDQYDVFLLQATGQRRWLISDDPNAPRGFREDAELKLLREFTPTHDWVLEPGDMLYVPPGVPHHGIGLGDTGQGECTTWSIGMRAPSRAELLVDFAEFLADRLDEADRYGDPDLKPQPVQAAIGDEAIARVESMLRDVLALDRAKIAEWFPRFITRYRSSHDAAPTAQPTDAAKLDARLRKGNALYRSPWSRVAIVGADAAKHDADEVTLVVAGERHPMSLAGAKAFAASKRYVAEDFAALSPRDRETVVALLNQGHLVIARA